QRGTDAGDVACETKVCNPSSVALKIPSDTEARAPLRIPHHGRAALVPRAIEIEPTAEVERQAAVVPPRVVDVRRIGFDVVADASLKDRQPVDEGGGVVLENGVDSRALNDRGRGGNVVLAAGLPVVVLPPFLEVVEP